MEVHLPSSCAHGILSPSCVGSILPTALVQLVLLVVVVLVDPADADAHLLLILRLILADNSIHSRLMAGNCWQTSLPASCLLACLLAWSIIVHLLMHLSVPSPPSASLQVAWLIELSCSLCALAFLLFLPSEAVLTQVHYFYAIHGLPMRIVLIRILLSWTTHSSPVKSIQPASPLCPHSSRWSWL